MWYVTRDLESQGKESNLKPRQRWDVLGWSGMICVWKTSLNWVENSASARWRCVEHKRKKSASYNLIYSTFHKGCESRKGCESALYHRQADLQPSTLKVMRTFSVCAEGTDEGTEHSEKVHPTFNLEGDRWSRDNTNYADLLQPLWKVE